MIGIVNASPLIYLAKIGGINLLPKLYSEVWTTYNVKKEVLRKPTAPESLNLQDSFDSWLNIKKYTNKKLFTKLLKMNIHAGECSIIVLALEYKETSEKNDNIVILDDLASREIAHSLNLKITGTLGVLLKAVKANFISKPQCKQYLKKLIRNTTFWISATLYDKLLDELDRF